MNFTSSEHADIWARMKAKIVKQAESGCWVWSGRKAGGRFPDKQYGSIKINRRWWGAHRVSYRIHNSGNMGGMFVCHRCDNTLCIRPSHLFLGTNRDNIYDAIAKGRFNNSGSRNGRAILNEKQVREIKKLIAKNISNIRIANLYDISPSQISFIKNGRAWGHIHDNRPR